jgi:hypothetical protein
MVQLWLNVLAQPLNFPQCKSKSCSHFVDTHFKDIVAKLLELFSPRMAADSSIVAECCHKTLAFSKMHD